MGQCSKPKKVQGTIVSMAGNIKGKFIPLKSTLKPLLEIAGLLDEMKNYMTMLKNSDESVLSNFIQGKIWKEQSQDHGDKVVIPN